VLGGRRNLANLQQLLGEIVTIEVIGIAHISVLFDDPDGLRVEFNYVPGQGHLGSGGRLGPTGNGPASRYGPGGLIDGLTDAG